MSFFNWKKESDKQYAIVVHTNKLGDFYVDKRRINVCCSMDSSRSNGYSFENVNNSLMNLQRLFPVRKYSIVEI